MTLPISLKRGRRNAPPSCTASLIALIPVFIFEKIYSGRDRKTRRSVQEEDETVERPYKFVIFYSAKSKAQVSETGFCFFDIESDLGPEIVERWEFFFVAKFFDEGEFEFAVI